MVGELDLTMGHFKLGNVTLKKHQRWVNNRLDGKKKQTEYHLHETYRIHDVRGILMLIVLCSVWHQTLTV